MLFRTPSIFTFGASLLATAVPAVVAAQDHSSSYEQCADIADADARLECFDQAVRSNRRDEGDILNSENKDSLDDFGLNADQIDSRRNAALPAAARGNSVSGGEAAAENSEPSVIRSTIAGISINARRREIITLANGQIWKAKSNRSFRGGLENGWEIELRKTWSGGYRMTFKERSGFLSVERIR